MEEAREGNERVNVVVIAWADGELERAAFDRAVTAAGAVGHQVTAIDLVKDGFLATMPLEERVAYHQPAPSPAPTRTGRSRSSCPMQPAAVPTCSRARWRSSWPTH